MCNCWREQVEQACEEAKKNYTNERAHVVDPCCGAMHSGLNEFLNLKLRIQNNTKHKYSDRILTQLNLYFYFSRFLLHRKAVRFI